MNKKISYISLSLGISVLVQGCSIKGSQAFTPTGVKLSHSVGLGSFAFDEDSQTTPANVVNNYNTVIQRPIVQRPHFVIPRREMIVVRETPVFCPPTPVFIKPVWQNNCLPYNDTTTW